MKRSLLFLMIFAVSLSVFAQAISISPQNPTYAGDASDASFKVKATITNLTDSTLTLQWVRKVDSLATNWSSAFCDANLCWATWIESKQFSLASGASGDFSVTFYPANTAGMSKTIIHAYAVYDSANINATNIYTATALNTATASPRADDDKIRLFPNPTSASFRLTDYTGIARLDVFNIIGGHVKTFKVESSNDDRYDVGDLPNGMYIIRLLDKNNNILQTTRLEKR